MDVTTQVAVVGGGIVGLATALVLAERDHCTVTVLEAEGRIAAHQSGHNSGVIHSGLYYRPGSLKAVNCVTGRDAMYDFCQQESIPHERTGKLVVATSPNEIPPLDELERRGRANGLVGMRRIGAAEIRELEPEVAGIDGLWIEETGIVDFAVVAAAYARRIIAAGGEVRTGARLTGVRVTRDGLVLESTAGAIAAQLLVNCAGLQSDRVARLCGLDPGVQIVPFRGEYYYVRPERRALVRHLVYPVPDPAMPFLGVHFTRTVDGRVEAGPNAVLAFRREGYERWDISPADLAEVLRFPGFWRMARANWRTGVAEWHRSLSKERFVRSLQRLVPAITPADVTFGGSGVRAQAVDRTGKLLDDFHIVEAERMVHVLNAPSPAATASLSIGRTVAGRIGQRLAAIS